MNAGFFEGFEGGRFGVRAARFDAALGEDPTSAAGLHQKKFEAAAAYAVANGCDLWRGVFDRETLAAEPAPMGDRVRDAVGF